MTEWTETNVTNLTVPNPKPTPKCRVGMYRRMDRQTDRRIDKQTDKLFLTRVIFITNYTETIDQQNVHTNLLSDLSNDPLLESILNFIFYLQNEQVGKLSLSLIIEFSISYFIMPS